MAVFLHELERFYDQIDPCCLSVRGNHYYALAREAAVLAELLRDPSLMISSDQLGSSKVEQNTTNLYVERIVNRGMDNRKSVYYLSSCELLLCQELLKAAVEQETGKIVDVESIKQPVESKVANYLPSAGKLLLVPVNRGEGIFKLVDLDFNYEQASYYEINTVYRDYLIIPPAVCNRLHLPRDTRFDFRVNKNGEIYLLATKSSTLRRILRAIVKVPGMT
ncbi:MAG: hypothetical protein ACFFD4_22440 [Candidatus Odinarchaeota archaeon]